MKLSKKQELGVKAALEILSDVAKWDYSEEEERLDLAVDTLYEMLESSRKQKAKQRHKEIITKGER